MHIALVAGELSGDALGAGLMCALKARHPDLTFTGIGGPQMIAQGLQSLVPIERLSVMGLVEVIRHLPALFSIRHQLFQHLKKNRPAVFIGIDAPDFNLSLAHKLRAAGIPTVHYVSPSVWAWRPWRVRKIVRAVDLMLTLFPFEAAFYAPYPMRVCCVGHLLADTIPLRRNGMALARHTLGLGLSPTQRVVALLPGSRNSEVKTLGPLFLETAQWLYQQQPDLQFLLPAATPLLYDRLSQWRVDQAPTLPLTVLRGQSHDAMAAADVVLVASGTATLEALLIKRPMVVAYRVAPLTAWIAKKMVTAPYFALPNLLAGYALVPEYFQEEATAQHLGQALLYWLDNARARAQLIGAFDALHMDLRRNANDQAAEAVLALLAHHHP